MPSATPVLSVVVSGVDLVKSNLSGDVSFVVKGVAKKPKVKTEALAKTDT